MDHTDGPFSMHNVPGDHFTMMESSHVAAVARIVRQNLMRGGSDPRSQERTRDRVKVCVRN